jgi:hypothetical protein
MRDNYTSKQNYTQRYKYDIESNSNYIGSKKKRSFTRAYNFRISLIRGRKLTRAQKDNAITSSYMVSLGCGTAETSLSMEECEYIQKPPVNSILPKIGINRKTARYVVFGTMKYGGLCLAHLSTVQGLYAVFLGHTPRLMHAIQMFNLMLLQYHLNILVYYGYRRIIHTLSFGICLGLFSYPLVAFCTGIYPNATLLYTLYALPNPIVCDNNPC